MRAKFFYSWSEFLMAVQITSSPYDCKNDTVNEQSTLKMFKNGPLIMVWIRILLAFGD